MAFDFKKEEDVKDYLNNLEIQYKFSCHSENNPEACHLLGDFMEAIKKDFPAAAKLYKMSCDTYNFPRSCHTYGSYSLLGKGLPKENYLDAYRYFSKGCELNNSASCCNAGVMLVSTDEKLGFLYNMNRGIALLTKGCETGTSEACHYLSGIYLAGSKDKAIEKNMVSAAKFAQMGCDLKNMYSCTNLSIMYRKGDGVEQNNELAEKFKKKAIELQNEHNDTLLLNFQRGPDT